MTEQHLLPILVYMLITYATLPPSTTLKLLYELTLKKPINLQLLKSM